MCRQRVTRADDFGVCTPVTFLEEPINLLKSNLVPPSPEAGRNKKETSSRKEVKERQHISSSASPVSPFPYLHTSGQTAANGAFQLPLKHAKRSVTKPLQIAAS